MEIIQFWYLFDYNTGNISDCWYLDKFHIGEGPILAIVDLLYGNCNPMSVFSYTIYITQRY